MNETILLIFCLGLSVSAIRSFDREGSGWLSRAVLVFLVSLSTFLIGLFVVADHFTQNGIDESVRYHLVYGLEGAGFSDYSGLMTAIGAFFLAMAVLLVTHLLAKPGSRWSRFEASRKGRVLPLFLSLLSILANPAIPDLKDTFTDSLVVETDSPDEAVDSTGFSTYYRTPRLFPMTQGETKHPRKNLVLVYAESLERTFFDEERFPGLMNGLRELESRSTHFSDIRQLAGTSWTIGGIVASQCGIPLFTPSHGNSMSGMDEFLPSAVCFSDLLHDEGYYLAYLGGADIEFAGKGRFFTTHSFDEVLGIDELGPHLVDPGYRSAWGLFDDTTFDVAFDRFVDLSRNDENFALVVLTLDTHTPRGNPSASCDSMVYGDGKNEVLNGVACSDRLITDFATRIIDSPHAQSTILVIASDHLALGDPFRHKLKEAERRDLFMIIDPSQPGARAVERRGSTLDYLTTILPFMGFEAQIGLGRDLLGEAESIDQDIIDIHQKVRSWRRPTARFWAFPTIRKSLLVDPSRRRIDIDRRGFNLPILIELDEDLATTLRFEFDHQNFDKTLVEELVELPPRAGYILVADCEQARRLDSSLPSSGICLIAGNVSGGAIEARRLKESEAIDVEEIRRLTAAEPFEPRSIESGSASVIKRIAHAGGGIDGKIYTNSIEALDLGLERGFEYFEIDLSFTSDDQLVCMHDWDKSIERSFGLPLEETPTLAEFEELVKTRSSFKKCTLETLISWLREHPETLLITDTKGDNLAMLKSLAEHFPEYRKRVVPQIYLPQNIEEVKKMGFEHVIWTLHRFPGDDHEVLSWVDSIRGLSAVTMPKARARSELPAQLLERGVPTFAHTVNDPDEARILIEGFRVAEIYTDVLGPGKERQTD